LDDAQLVLDAGVVHRRRLDAVAQRLVEEGEAVGGERGPLPEGVPVVDDVRLTQGRHGTSVKKGVLPRALRSERLERDRDALAAADAGRAEPELVAAGPELVEQVGDDAGARGP